MIRYGKWVPRGMNSPLALGGMASARKLFLRIAASWATRLIGRPQLPAIQELSRLRPGTRVLVAGFAAWIGVVGMAFAGAVVWLELSTMSMPTWLSASWAGLSWTTSSPIRDQSAGTGVSANADDILQRPLFSRARRMVASEQPAEPPLPPPALVTGPDTNIALRGVFMNAGIAKAFLVSAQNPDGAWAQTNDEIAGWRVLEIQPNQVLLGGSGHRLAIQYTPNGGK